MKILYTLHIKCPLCNLKNVLEPSHAPRDNAAGGAFVDHGSYGLICHPPPRVFPALKICRLTDGPIDQKRWSQSTRFFGWLPEVPSEPVSEKRGKRSAVATPTLAVAA